MICFLFPAIVSYPEGEARLYFRRLSQTTQTDALLGNLDVSNSGRIILRPLSVQERIRELNFRARHFADTMLAIQGNGGPVSRHTSHPMGPRSLQVVIWHFKRSHYANPVTLSIRGIFIIVFSVLHGVPQEF